MTLKETISHLESFGNEQTRKTLMRHGAPENVLGVKVRDMKKIQKKIKKDHALALELYDTGIPDAMYFAGLIADETVMDEKTLERWIQKSHWQSLNEYTIPWLAADSGLGFTMGLKWIEAKDEKTASAGWSCLSSALSVTADKDIDLARMNELLDSINERIKDAPARVVYCMNGFVIAAGCFVAELADKALSVGKSLGKLEIDMGDTACKVPYAETYIQKVIDRGSLGKKKKMARC